MKNRKFSTPLGMGLTASLLAAGWAGAATLNYNLPSAPTGAIVESTAAASFTRAFDNHATLGDVTRGNTFLMPDAGGSNTSFSVTGLTLRKDVQQTFGTGDELELWIFAYNPSNDGNNTTNWVLGDGADDDDPLDGTGSTLLLPKQTFSLNTLTLNDDQYFTFDFSSSPLTLLENTVYGFILGYVDGETAGANFQYAQGAASNSTYADGALLRNQQGANSTVTADLTFYVTGTAIPEPSAAALLLMSGAGLMIRRRRR